MTGLNRALIEDEKTFCKSVTRYISYQAGVPLPVAWTRSDFPVSEADKKTFYGKHYYQSNTLYFLNSNEVMAMELDLFDFESSEDPENAVSIKEKKTYRIVVKGLGIPANFTQEIPVHPSLQIVKEFVSGSYAYTYGTEFGEEPIPIDQIKGMFTYQVNRETLGISDWQADLSESSQSDKNKAMLSQAKRAWLGRLHGDIIDMAFYLETNDL